MTKDTVKLYVDDLRDCPEGFVIARTFEEAVEAFDRYDIEVLSMDHDLGEDANGVLLQDGYDFIKYFCENGLYAKKIYMHTDNGVGRENMYKTLLGAQRRGFIADDIEIYYYSITVNRYTGE